MLRRSNSDASDFAAARAPGARRQTALLPLIGTLRATQDQGPAMGCRRRLRGRSRRRGACLEAGAL